MKDSIKIVYISIDNSEELTNNSGTTYFIKKAISLPGVELTVIDKLKIKTTLSITLRRIFGKIMNKRYDIQRSKVVLKEFAKEIESRLPKDFDVILVSSSLPIAYLKTTKPTYFYTDATFHSLLDYYFLIKNLSQKTIEEGNMHEQQAIDKATGIFYTSQCAADDAINYYKADRNKIKVILRGANFDKQIPKDIILNYINKRIENPVINLLFIGVDWKRKGGNIVLETAKLIEKSGYKVHLDIVGISKMSIDLPDFCHSHGFIDKNTEEGQEKLQTLYLNSDFFFMPSRQECMGIVFVEANSFAVPSISTNVGGISSIVENKINGFTLDYEAQSDTYKELIIELKKDKIKYKKLALNAYNAFITKSNWQVIGKTIVNEIRQNLSKINEISS